MTAILTPRMKLDVVTKALEVDQEELLKFLGLRYSNSPPWTVVFDSTVVMELLDQLYLMVEDPVPKWKNDVLSDIRSHIKKGGTLGSLFRISMLYPKPR